ncbi:MAG: ACP S-malonyltransferase [Acutalibacter sp.]|jgi:[acyl-carrier-protein] S-malonyltransferase|uniref:ACP S-malonyltransferase n=1 Tax=Acutalibacter sp. TaxID=1918636 RepID=UPI00216EC092|nr:ACP S-malonyltransferase [Acutalibacter sp.]MCI9225077.1 ACP S-malonyltransferase [Acutalibacter sp.]
MGKIAFVFSGQGAQYPGMGQSLCEASPAAKFVFELADSLRPGTSSQCFSGTVEELSVTKNTQPCLYCVDLAAAKALEEKGVRADYAAGFSLGEVAAAAFAGIFTDKSGFEFVCRRAEAMQKAAEENPGSMAAVLKLTNEKVEELCGKFTRVWPVNYNCPGQLVVAGESSQLKEFQELVKAEGGRAAPLAVSGGFHSPFMESAASELEDVLANIELGRPRLPVYANFTAKPYSDNAKDLLVSQVKSPVRWQETVEALAAQGVDTFLECGPGKTLCGLIKKTVKTARVFQVQDAETLNAALSEII